jgi:hypothetical protein
MKTIQISKKALSELLKTFELYITQMDEIMKMKQNNKREAAIAKALNKLQLDFQIFLHYELNIDITKLHDFTKYIKSI